MPIDLILLIDTSSSMSDKMDVVHEAAVGFLKTLRDTATAAPSSPSPTASTSSSRSPPIARSSSRRSAARGPRRDLAEQRDLHRAEAVRRARRQDGDRCGARPSRSCRTAKTPRASSASTTCSRWRGRAASASTRSSAVTSTRGPRGREGTPVLLRVGLLDEDAGAGDRGAGVLPAVGHRAQGYLRRHRRGAVESVLDWLRAEQRAGRTAGSGGL